MSMCCSLTKKEPFTLLYETMHLDIPAPRSLIFTQPEALTARRGMSQISWPCEAQHCANQPPMGHPAIVREGVLIC